MRGRLGAFVLATDEVWRLQGGRDVTEWRANGGTDPECIAFQEMAAGGHYGPGAGSKQGIYVCTGAGELLGSINSNSPQNVVRMLDAALAKWGRLGAGERRKEHGKSAPEARFEWAWPKGGMALRVTMRYLPQDDDPGRERSRSYNHDHAWFSSEEAQRFVPEKLEVGAERVLEDVLFQRIARLHLVDAVRGETRPFDRVEGEIRVEVIAVDDGGVDLKLSGRAVGRGEQPRRGLFRPLGIKAELLGRARYSRKDERFVSLEFVGKGVRWAESRRRRRWRSSVRPIGWHFALAPEPSHGVRIAPTQIRQYSAPWLRRR